MISHLPTASYSRREFFSTFATIALLYLLDRCNTHQPKFKFGDRVALQYVCDDELDPDDFGKTFYDAGTVYGIAYNVPAIDKGYAYYVLFDEDTDKDFPHYEPYHETRLIPYT